MELDEEQRVTLRQFQEITNIQDREVAACTLASLDWNLERAIETHLLNEADGGDDIQIIRPDIEEIPPPLRHVSPIQPTRVLPIEIEQDNVNGTVDMDTDLDSTFNDDENDITAPHPPFNMRTLRSTRQIPAHQPSSSRPSNRVYVVDDSDDDELFGEDDATNRDDAIARPKNRAHGGIPLIPEDSESIQESINNFISVFESRYCSKNGAFMPCFSTDSLSNTAREAFDAPGRPVEDRKPLALYIHNDNSVAANIFASEIMCRDEISSLLRHQFVLWGWDVTSKQNSVKLFDWLKLLNISENRHFFEAMHYDRDRYPLLVLLIKEKGTIKIYEMCDGRDTRDQVMHKLLECIEEYTSIRLNEKQEQTNREERERILKEQAEEYEKSLAADLARREAKAKEIREQKEEEERRIRAEENEKIRRAKLESELPSEPADNETGVVTVKFRVPEGEQLMRKFRATDSLNVLLKFLSSKGYNTDQYRFFNSDFPKKDISTWDANSTFSALKFPPREQIFVEEQ